LKLQEIPELLKPATPKAKRLSMVALTGAALAVVWAGAAWAGVEAPDSFVSAVGTLAAEPDRLNVSNESRWIVVPQR